MIRSKVIPAEVLEAGVDSFMIIGMWPEGGVYLSFRLADPIVYTVLTPIEIVSNQFSLLSGYIPRVKEV